MSEIDIWKFEGTIRNTEGPMEDIRIGTQRLDEILGPVIRRPGEKVILTIEFPNE